MTLFIHIYEKEKLAHAHAESVTGAVTQSTCIQTRTRTHKNESCNHLAQVFGCYAAVVAPILNGAKLQCWHQYITWQHHPHRCGGTDTCEGFQAAMH